MAKISDKIPSTTTTMVISDCCYSLDASEPNSTSADQPGGKYSHSVVTVAGSSVACLETKRHSPPDVDDCVWNPQTQTWLTHAEVYATMSALQALQLIYASESDWDEAEI
jgi:hypothetical protein